MFIDASAIIAMLTDEDSGTILADRMGASKKRLTCPTAIWETITSIARFYNLPVADAKITVEEFISASKIQVMAIPPKASSLAIEAYDKYGIGRHAASLNSGDCMSYACARYYRLPLLFAGYGFSKTDIEPA